MDELSTKKTVPEYRRFIAMAFLVASVVLFILGLTHPLMSTKYQVLNVRIRSQYVSLFDSVSMFWSSGDYLISSIILVFTFILPVTKYFELGLMLLTGKTFRLLNRVDKWNMIDVFLVSLLLLNFKMNSNFIVMNLESGTTFIALAVLTRLVTIFLSEDLDDVRK